MRRFRGLIWGKFLKVWTSHNIVAGQCDCFNLLDSVTLYLSLRLSGKFFKLTCSQCHPCVFCIAQVAHGQRVIHAEVCTFCADMDKTLSKLDVGPRSTLILVGQGNPTDNPSHSRASASNAADTSSQSEPDTTGGSYVGKFLSFLSPYIYGRPAASGDQNGYSSVPQDGKFHTLLK